MRSRFARFLPYLLLGPLTGPLAAGMVRAWRSGDRLLSSLYGVSILTTWAGLAALTAHLAPH